MADFGIQATRSETPGLTRNDLSGQIKSPMAPDVKKTGGNEISFRDSLKNFISDVDQMQKISGQKTEQFIAGEITDVHEVMIAVEKASTSFQFLMELRNKMLDSYQEIKRMTV